MAQIPRRNGSADQVDRRWIVRLQEAQAHYWRAVKRHQRTVEQLEQAVSADRSVGKAHRAMALALGELVRYQKGLVNLVLGQENPPPSDEEDKR